jgi:hypothetical protein
MLMWGDIVANHPELVHELPHGVTVLEWGYEADHPFRERGRVLRDEGRPFWVCPGTSSWISLLGRWTNARHNIAGAAAAAAELGAGGLLVTDWGDLGHLQHLPVSLPPLAYAAATAWCLDTNRDIDVAAALDRHVFNDDAGVLGGALLELGDVHRLLSAQMPNMSMLVMPLYLPKLVLGRGPAQGLSAEQFAAARAALGDCRKRLAAATPRCEDARVVLDELDAAIELVELCCDDAVARLAEGDGSLESIPAATRQALAARLPAIIERHRALWLGRNRPGGLDDSCARLERLRRCYETGSTEGVPFYG